MNICHASVSGSPLGEEDNIDRNSPKINKTARIAPTNIATAHLYWIGVQSAGQGCKKKDLSEGTVMDTVCSAGLPKKRARIRVIAVYYGTLGAKMIPG